MSQGKPRDGRGEQLLPRRRVLALAGVAVLGGCGRATGNVVRDADGAARRAGAYVAWRLWGSDQAATPADGLEPPIIGRSSLDGRR